MRIKPISREALIELLAQRVLIRPGFVRVAIDGLYAGEFAYPLIEVLKANGRDAIHVRTADFLKPASVRLEDGRHNPESFYYGWIDTQTLSREVLNDSGRILPTFWNADTDRATRAPYVQLGPGGVVVVTGELLLGNEMRFDLTVHLEMSAAALARRIDPSLQWTLPAWAQYSAEVNPAEFADVVVRMNDPAHPALVERHKTDRWESSA